MKAMPGLERLSILCLFLMIFGAGLLAAEDAVGVSGNFRLDTRDLGPVISEIKSERGNHLVSGMPGGSGGFRFEALIQWNDENEGDGSRSARFRVNRQWYTASLETVSNDASRATVTVSTTLGTVSSTNGLEVEATNRRGKKQTTLANVYFYPPNDLVALWFGLSPVWNVVGGNVLDVSREVSVELWSFSNPSGVLSTSAGYSDALRLRFDPYAGTYRGNRSLSGNFDKTLQFSGVENITGGSVTGSGGLDVSLAGTSEPAVAGTLGLGVSGKSGIGAPVSIVVDALFPPLAPVMQTLRNTPVISQVLNAFRLRAFLLGGLGIDATWLDEQGNCWLGASSVDVNGTLGLEAQGLVEVGSAKVGVYAGGTGTPGVQICPDLAFQGVLLRGYVGAFAEYLVFALREEVGWETTLGGPGGSREMRFFPQDSDPAAWQPLRDRMLDHGTANHFISRSTRSATATRFVHERQEGSDGAIEEILLENVNPLASPRLSLDGTVPIIHHVLLDVDKPWYAGTDIAELEFTGADWVSSRVTDDLLAEFSPATASIPGGGLLAAWTRVGGDISDAEGPEDILAELEIVVAERDGTTGDWTTPVQLTDNQVLDRDPVPFVFANGKAVVWVQNAGGVSPGSALSGDRLLVAGEVAGTWQAPQVLWQEDKGLVQLAVTVDGQDEAHVLFTVDEDGDPETTADRELYAVSTSGGVWQSPTRLTDNAVEDSLPLLLAIEGTPTAIWKSGENLLYSVLNPWNPQAIYQEQTLANEAPTLAGIELAGGAAIAYTTQTGDGVDIVAAFYDAADDIWSLPRQLTNDEDAESGISMAWDGEDLMLAYVKTRTVRQDVDVEIEGTVYTIPNVPQPSQADIALLCHRPGLDPSLAAGSLVIDPPIPAAGTTATLTVQVQNRGDYTVENIDVSFYEGDPEAGGVLIGTTTVPGSLLAGDNAEAELAWTVPDASAAVEVFAVVDPDENLDDRNRLNNTVSEWLIAPVVEVVTGRSDPLSQTRIRLECSLANLGSVPTGNFGLSFRYGAVDGEEIARIDSIGLDGDDEETLDVIWDVVDREFNNRFVVVYAVADPDGVLPGDDPAALILPISVQVDFTQEGDSWVIQ